MEKAPVPRVSVVMPTYAHAAFIRRAIDSLRMQLFPDWELLIVDDGSPDETADLVAGDVDDARVRLIRLDRNRGLGAALNTGLDQARGDLIAYLPSDDVLHREHLGSLVEALDADRSAVMAVAGIRHHYNRLADGRIEGESLQLVQVLHRAGPERWVEREELVTDDLDRMLWSRLRERGHVVETGRITCEWVSHPHQLHLVLREPIGGVNRYRWAYAVPEPLRVHTSVGNRIDEVSHYRRFRERPDTPAAADGLRILLVGELAYNPERVLALEERGHRLYGLWMPEPQSLNTVGPLPFGHVTDLPYEGWGRAAQEAGIDVIYALLNWQAVPFVHQVFRDNRDGPRLPFAWHFKEGPFICFEKGTWRELVELTDGADLAIHSSPEQQRWWDTVLPGHSASGRSWVLDGDLPKRDWFEGVARTRRLSEEDGEIHTVVPGRPIGLHVATIGELAEQGIHVHFYGDFTHGLWKEWIPRAQAVAPRHLHLHSQVDQDRWTEEFSRYDAGWLHVFTSKNEGDLHDADWDDLNYPARIATLIQAGLPLLTRENPGDVVATQSLVRDRGLGVLFRDIPHLAECMRDERAMARVRETVWRERSTFTFDHHADALVARFREAIDRRR